MYSCYTKGAQEKKSFLARTTPNPIENMQACEKILQENLIPKFIGKDNISHHFRDIASLPLKMGGLNINLPSDYESFLEWSIKKLSVLDTYDPLTAISEQEKIYTKNKTLKAERTNQKKTNIWNNLNDHEKYALELAKSNLHLGIFPGSSAASEVEARKRKKYSDLLSTVTFEPIAIETLGKTGRKTIEVIKDLAGKIKDAIREKFALKHLKQRLDLAVLSTGKCWLYFGGTLSVIHIVKCLFIYFYFIPFNQKKSL